MKVVEIGDIVATDNGEKMVVDIYRNRVSKELMVKCVDTDDSPDGADTQPQAMTYRRSSVTPIFHSGYGSR
jgi:hypothetical protein